MIVAIVIVIVIVMTLKEIGIYKQRIAHSDSITNNYNFHKHHKLNMTTKYISETLVNNKKHSRRSASTNND